MTDLEMTKLCAEKMGYGVRLRLRDGIWRYAIRWGRGVRGQAYNPLIDDQQAMVLVKHFGLGIAQLAGGQWEVCKEFYRAGSPDLNRAIVECVAKMQANTGAGER
jgi:hypothetical protein